VTLRFALPCGDSVRFVTKSWDAAVVGAGPNGLVAANVLADAGWSVRLLEASDEPGGSVRSAELVEPGFLHDVASSFYPLGAASPVFAALGLDVPWRHGPLVLAHPALDGSCAVLERGPDPIWDRLEPALLAGLTSPFPQLGALALVARDVASLGALRTPPGALERRLREGCALHTDAPPASFTGRAYGALLAGFGRRHGFPCVAGGAGELTRLLVERAAARGVDVDLGVRVSRLPVARRAVLAAVDAWELGRLLDRPVRVRPDPATLKVDWTLDAPLPWTAAPPRRSPVVHLGGPGRVAIVGQYSMVDAARMPAGAEVAWAYTHDHADPDALEAQVETHAPGFRALIRGRRVSRFPPGRVNGGTARWTNQLVLRGRLGGPWTGVPGLYLASASAHPGGAVHGAPGWIAAQAALRSSDRRRLRRLESFTSSSRTTT
jgi:phytoene dehydrogenase-like protein